ncbi:centromere/kinetochore protein zw10 homolog isoform X2 [Mangifera indica]|uniref:centromere/kinetochore protein zw10 homolog isoform X2 n=1 Tax=Mangifera indica TaxID=29780 RepID=UPI001CFBB23F|nr:centromere/kinetochore protein zw10 homolog isoform X2 [Mangifera indica]
MDALFETINVSDLLSTHDLSDPTAPLSAPDLRLLISRLESHSLQIKSKVQSYILSHRQDFASLFSVCSDAVSRAEEISTNLSEILELISDHPIDAEVKQIIEEVGEKMRELRVKREMLELLRVIVRIYERLKGVREAVRDGRLKFAAEEVRELKKALRIGDEDEKEPIVYGLLRKEWFDCFEGIQELLVKYMESAVQFEQESNRVLVKYRLNVEGIDGIELHTVLEAMEAVGILNYGLAKVADMMVKYVITPAVNFGSPITFVEEGDEGAEATLKIVPSVDSRIESADGKTIYCGIIQVIKFIHKSICFKNGSWVQCLGRLMWPRISEQIISKYLSKGYTRESPGWNNDGVAEHFPKHLVDLLFLSERCVVSRAASQLVELVHQTLKDVCLSSPRVALEFYRAARDAMLLYEAVIPVKLERQLDGINQVAALVHNDCLYLSQEILGLAFEYQSDFPSSIKEHAVFVDMAPRFHLMAEEILQRQIQRVNFNLREAIDGADGFQNTHQMQQFESAKFSLDQIVFILEKVHIIWEPLLLPSTFKRSMCMVLESVFSRITRDILLIDDMAAEETLQLQRLIHLMLENLSSLLESISAVKQKGKAEEESAHPLEDFIPSLCKIRKLAELLDMPLKSITTAWESGELFSCGFALSEVQDFIKSIFADSALRKECLWRIESVSL